MFHSFIVENDEQEFWDKASRKGFDLFDPKILKSLGDLREFKSFDKSGMVIGDTSNNKEDKDDEDQFYSFNNLENPDEDDF